MGLAGALDTLASQAVGGTLAWALPCRRRHPHRLSCASGAERLDVLPALFQRCLLFLGLHAVPLGFLVVLTPLVYGKLGIDPEVRAGSVHLLSDPADSGQPRCHVQVIAGVLLCVPGQLACLPLDACYRHVFALAVPLQRADIETSCTCRPMNRILVAMRITRPQMLVSAVCVALHWPLTHFLMVQCVLLVLPVASTESCACPCSCDLG